MARYYLRFGDKDVLQGNDLKVTWAGADAINKMILLGAPNLGSVSAIEGFIRGQIVGLRRIPEEVVATMPSTYQLFPHRIVDWLYDTSGERLDIDQFDAAIWRELGWNVFSPAVRARVIEKNGADYYQRLTKHFARNAERARRFSWALTVCPNYDEGKGGCAEVLEPRRAAGADYSVIGTLTNLVPNNIFADLAGSRPLSIIGVVVFGLLFGIAAALVGEENPERGEQIRSFIDTTQAVVMRLVKIVISLTPYGVLALMTRVIVTTDGRAILNLISFVVASYIAIAIMFVVHTVLIGLFGGNIRSYFQKVWPVLTFAFVTRSSAATIPLTIRAQIEELNVPAPIANIAASFGATIGQNGCAGLYPAMLAVMVAASGGTEISFEFVISLVLIVAIGSFGIAGVGGGATNAALVVLPALGFPVTIAALLISIEPLIDMARTALNVNGSITAGIITSKFLGSKDADGVLAESDV